MGESPAADVLRNSQLFVDSLFVEPADPTGADQYDRDAAAAVTHAVLGGLGVFRDIDSAEANAFVLEVLFRRRTP